jgi:hypothetical protein
MKEIAEATAQEREISECVQKAYASEGVAVPQFLQAFKLEEEKLLPDLDLRNNAVKREPYPLTMRSESGVSQDKKIVLVRQWFSDPMTRPEGMNDKKFKRFIKFSRQFFANKEHLLYKRGKEGMHRLFVEQEHRMFMMRATHNSLGHRGVFSTRSLLELRFWWPEMERDIAWFVRTCEVCQKRDKALHRTPPVQTMTPSIFQKIHVDVMNMSITSNGCKYIIAARCALSRYLEARGLRAENAEAIGKFLLEEIICRWGCPRVIVSDNAKQFIAALKWLESKYGITGIQIAPYNSKANGVVERGHYDIRQSLVKATGGDGRKWFFFLPQVVWSDRITTRRGLGCSPYFAVCGAHPVIPLDIVEATWLTEYPDRKLTTDELIGLRARSLSKHAAHVEEMRERVSEEKIRIAQKYAKDHKYKIKDYSFVPGDVVLLRNSGVEKSLDSKYELTWTGPIIVIRRTRGGAYLCCEMNGAMMHGKIAAYRVKPFAQRRKFTLPEDIEDLIDISKETLDDMVENEDKLQEYVGRDFQFGRVRLSRTDRLEASDSESENDMDDGDELPMGHWDVPEEQPEGPRRSNRHK